MTDSERQLLMARDNITFGRHALTGGFAGEAGRNAYMAAFHAAHAFIIVRTGKRPKTHAGTRTEFSRLANLESAITRAETTFFARAYELKTSADYEDAEAVTMAEAIQSLEQAEAFIALITGLITPVP